ncbi:MAG: ATP-binding protein [Elusimicrobiota bacterium]
MRLGLRAKVLLAFLPLSMLAGGLIVTLERSAVHSILIDELAQRVLSRTSEFTPGMAAASEAHDENLALSRLHALIDQTHASYAVALDTAGFVVAHTNVVERGKTYRDAVTLSALARQEPGYTTERDGGRETLDVSIPVWENSEDFLLASEGGRRRVGTLRIGLPLDDAAKTEARILRQLIAVLGVGGGGALLLILLLTARALRPILPLTKAAAEIGEGRYTVSVPIVSNDELGDLATAFNKMAGTLSRTTVSKEYFTALVNATPLPIVALDLDANVTLWNPAAEKLFGWSAEEVVGRPYPAASEDERAKLLKAFGDTLAGHATKDRETIRGHRDGTQILVSVSAAPLYHVDGIISGGVAVIADLTERKALESRMAQSEKLSAIGQLAAGVAHEINNPLGVILGFAQSLNRKIADGDALALPLRSIMRESLRCKELVQNLLTFSRQERKTLEPLELTDVVSNALLLVEAQARIRGVELRRELGTESQIVKASSNQLQQIVINLCTNAMDATPQGGSVTVSCLRRRRDGRDWVRLEVRDTGSGIPRAIRQKIFDPFFTTKDPGKGTGLGLSLVHELVNHHNGRLDYASEEGRGTSFFVDLPLCEIAVGENI